MYAFLTGPMFWLSIAVFVIGLTASGHLVRAEG
jgi:hypothetical protein